MPQTTVKQRSIAIRGRDLGIADIDRIARRGASVELTPDPQMRDRIDKSAAAFARAAATGTRLYGVTTQFGGRSDVDVPPDETGRLQANLIHSHLTGVGDRLSNADVRAGITIRLNSLVQGNSGVRYEVLNSMLELLNRSATPHIFEHGSIGASGDLVPLAYVAGCLMGLDSVQVEVEGVTLSARQAMSRVGLEPIEFRPKEALAVINGTSMTSGIAANCFSEVRGLVAISMLVHSLFMQATTASAGPFEPFIHSQKPHPGQVWVAGQMLELLAGSRMVENHERNGQAGRGERLFQDRYGVRCLPQYLGPVVDGLRHIGGQITTECNSVTDNPVWDEESDRFFHGGNFLAQYVAVGMDQLRFYLSLMAKHLGVQVAHLTLPVFSNGLPASLCLDGASSGVGLKALQLTANSILPKIMHNGMPLVDRFPTYAEQFNQNINSQGFGAANLARRSIDLFRDYLSIALIFGVQAVDLRAHSGAGCGTARSLLSESSARLYVAVREVLGRSCETNLPLIDSDERQSLGQFTELLADDIQRRGKTWDASGHLLRSLDEFLFE